MLAWGLPALFLFTTLLHMRYIHGDPMPIAILISLVAFVPVLSWLLSLTATLDVRSSLKTAFGHVPILGLSSEQIAAADLSRCRQCGYDLRGLRDDVCPECGRATPKPTDT